MGFIATASLGLLLFQAGPAVDAETDKLARALDRTVQRSTKGGFWGTILVAREGKVILAKGYGFADLERRPNTPTTLFEIASTSKQVCATAVLRLVQEKKLTLDDPLSKFFTGVPADKRGVTVRHLIHHTSGIDNNTGLPYGSTASRKQFIAHVMRARMISQPGERFAYFNSGYGLMAAIVEVVSKQSFEAFCHAKLFKPAELVDTGFVNEKQLDRTRQTIRLDERPGMGGTACDWHYGWGYRGMGGVVSTAEDMLRWDRALRGDDILDAATRKILYTPALQGYACGWRISTTPRGTRKAQHSGSVAGYRIQFARYLEDDAVILVLSNDNANIHQIEQALAALLFPPPRVELTLAYDVLSLNEHQIGQKTGRVTWKAKPHRGNVRLTLRLAGSRRPLAELLIPKTLARGLLGQVERARAGKGDEVKKESEAGVYLQPYRLVRGSLTLTEQLTVMIRSQYDARGQAPDPRPTFIVIDAKHRQWPIMAKLSLRAAKQLATELQRASR